ncbi:MAG: AAA family ATPase [candidate division WOR-3 bacterium]
MRIKELDIFGFKSFPEKTRILFSQGITAILGPNGCGKTNIFDAFRWVLGEQTLSLLRCSKIEELIFGGTKEVPPLNYCEVKLIIENDGNWPEYSNEIEIKRCYYRSGESEYFINRQPCRLKDIEDLFSKVGSYVYSIFDITQMRRIIQGEAKELFFEAANLKEYFENRREIERKLINLNQELENLEVIIREKQRIVRNLQRQVKVYNEYLQLKEKEKEYQRKLLIKEIKNLEEKREKLKKEISEYSEKISEKEKEIAILVEEINKTQHQIEELKNKQEMVYHTYQGLLKEMNSLEREKIIYEEKNNFLLKEFAEKKKQKESLAFSLQKLAEETNLLKEDLVKINLEKETLETKIKEQQKEISEKEIIITELEKEIKNLWETLKNNFEENKKEESFLTKINHEINKIEEEIKEKKRKKEEIEKELREIEEKITKKEQLIAQLKEKYLSFTKKEKEEKLKLVRTQLGEDFLGMVKDFLEVEPGYESLVNQLLKRYLNFYVIRNLSFLFSNNFHNLLNYINDGFILSSFNITHENPIDLEKKEPLPLKNIIKFKENCPPFIKGKIAECYLVNNLTEAYYFYLKNPQFTYITKKGEIISKEGVVNLQKVKDWEVPPQELLKIYAEIYHLNNLSEIYSKKQEIIFQTEKEVEERIEELNSFLNKRKELEEKIDKLKEKEIFLREQLKNKEENLSNQRQEFKSKNEEMQILINKLFRLKENYYQKEQKIYEKEIEEEKIKKELATITEKIESANQEFLESEKEKNKLFKRITELKEEIAIIEKQLPEKMINIFLGEIQEKDKKINEYQKEILLIKDKIANNQIELASLEKELEINMNNLGEEFTKEFSYQEFSCLTTIDYEKEIEIIRKKIIEIGNVNYLAAEDYNYEKNELLKLLGQKKDILQGINNLKKSVEELEKKAKEIFHNIFQNVREEFKKTFVEIFTEGEADIILTEPENPFESQIVITAKPKGKNPKRLEHLSDGEKALLALSLLFSFYRIKKTPFLFLDEVDAPLDDINIKRFIKFLKELAQETQIIIITHNRLTLENADVLLGVTNPQPGVSKVFTIKIN